MKTKYARLTLADREEISRGIYAFEKFAAIARRLNRPMSTVSREVWANMKYSWCYRAEKADEAIRERNRKGQSKKLDVNIELKEYVYEKLRLEWSPEEIAKRVKLEYPERIKF